MKQPRRECRWLLLVIAFALGACRSAPEPPNLLLLISVDTLRADHLTAHGSDLGATPNLDRLAAESVVFTAAYAPAALTLLSMSALMTGRYPEEIGVAANVVSIAEGVPTLAFELREAGWRTRAVVSNWVLRRESGIALGFDVYDDELPQVEANRPMPERIAVDTTTAALREIGSCLEEPEARCFVWVHYQDPHGPYSPPDGLRERFLERERRRPDGHRELPVRDDNLGLSGLPRYQALGAEREVAFYRAGYDGEVAYLDEQIGRLLAGLAPRARPERTILVFTADHGEGMGEGDYWFAHGEYLTDSLVRVPLWLRIPGVSPGRRDDVATLLDLHATLRRLGETDASNTAVYGRDLLAPGAAERASTPYFATLGASTRSRYGWIEGGYKYIVTLGNGVWQGQLFKLGNDEIDLAAPAPQLGASMRERLATFREQMPTPAPVVPAEISESDRAKLRALGYESSVEPREEPPLH